MAGYRTGCFYEQTAVTGLHRLRDAMTARVAKGELPGLRF
jgi:hypothetical protein